MSSYPMNQFAPTAVQGVNIPPPSQVGYEDRPYEYVYAPPNGQLTADQIINPDTVAIQTDADFYLRAWYISLYTGSFQIQLIDSTGYQLSDGMINSAAISQSSATPTVLSPQHPFPAGSKIQINIQDLSGATNPIQIVFKGVKRFRVNPSQAKAA
jgi:hypothetical protein